MGHPVSHDPCGRHPRGDEDRLPQILLVGTARGALDDRRERNVPGIAVLPHLAGLVPGSERERGGGDQIPVILQSGLDVTLTDAAGMCQKVKDRDTVVLSRDIIDPHRGTVVDTQFTVHFEAEDRGGGELLGDTPDVEEGLGRVGCQPLIRQALPLGKHDLAVLHDPHRTLELAQLLTEDGLINGPAGLTLDDVAGARRECEKNCRNDAEE